MSRVLSIFLLFAVAGVGFGQKPAAPKKPAGKQIPAKTSVVRKAPVQPVPTSTPDPEPDRTRFDAAVAASSNPEKARLLRLFVDEFPASELRPEALDYLITSRAVIGDEKVKAGDVDEGVASFKLAVEEAPLPTPDRLFDDVIAKIPANLFYGGHRGAAIDLAAAMEKKYAGDAKRLLGVAAFYLSIENGAEAKRVVEAAISLQPASAQAYQALGLAHRLNFDLDESAKAYAKAIELDPSSVPAKRSLAEMKRATGKPDEAAAIYREIAATNPSDVMARNGLVLSLFDAGKRGEAEMELTDLLARTPRNFTLLAGVGYWYAAHDVGDKAVEYGQKAVEIEPRYIWGHIALARGLMKLNRPVDAERVLIKAKQYANFPTLEYEIASARFKAGLYREAVEELQKSFVLRDGLIETKLGGRLQKAERTFGDLLAHERRASILEPVAADDVDASARLRVLFELTSKLASTADEGEVNALADEFVKGDDKMKLHRQLHAADILLQKNVAIPKAAELVKAAVGNTDAGLEVAAPGAAVMASELYESRTVAFARNEIVLIPEVPRQTLSAILRGRIEELAGWSFYQQRNYPAAVVRLRRAVSVMPDKSAWWRSSMWRLGTALEADGKDKEALDSYIQSYKTDRPSGVRYSVIESLYRKVNGSTDGLEEKIGPNPFPTVAGVTPVVTQPEKAESNAASSNALKTETRSGEKAPNRIVDPEKPVVRNDETVAEKAVPASTNEAAKITTEQPKEAAVQPQPKVESPTQTPVTETPKIDPPVSKAEIPSVVENVTAKTTPDASKNESPVNTETVSPPNENKQPKALETKTVDKPVAASVEPNSTKPVDQSTETKVVAEPVAEVKKPNETPIEEKPKGDQTAVAKSTEQTETIKPEIKPEAKPILDSPPEIPKKTDDGSIPESFATKQESVESKKVESDQPVNILRDPLPETPAEPKPTVTERKPLIILNDPVKQDNAPKTRDLFEPVIITVPRNSSQKPANSKVEDGAKPDPEKKAEDPVASGAVRQRVIEGKEIRSDQLCSIDVSQQNISLLSGGGSLGVLVSIAGDGKTNDVTASTNSPRDIEVRAQPEIAGLSERRFYVIKSVSESTGVFLVNFESPCGKKEITVRVR